MTAFISRQIRTLQIAVDSIVILSAWAISYWLRFYVIGSAQLGLESTFINWFFPLLVITLYFFLKNYQYDRRRQVTTTQEIMRLFRANGLSVVAFIIILYFFSEARISRLTIVLYSATSTALFIFARVFIRSLIRKLRRRGYLLETVFVAGDDSQVRRYLKTVEYLPGTGLNVIGIFGSSPGASQLSELEERMRTEKPDRVILAFEDDADAFVTEFVRRHFDQLFRLQVLAPDNKAMLGMMTESINDLHLMSFNDPQFSIPELTLKRGLDIFGSFVGLLILSPFLAVIAVCVKMGSEGPIFFGQERVGVNGHTFKMWKFRTMRAGTAAESKGWTIENDPRRTKTGTFLRKTSIDELPQLWNVLVGDMSLVGPRPEQTHFVEKFRSEIPAYMLRHKMRAGITGWAQVSGWRGDTSLHKRIEYDLYYIRNWSFWFDIKILAMTVVSGFINKNAY